MMNGQEFNEIISQPVNNPVIPHNYLADNGVIFSRDDSAEFGEIDKPLDCFNNVEGE